MFNWAFSFITDNSNNFISTGFVFCFCNLVVSTCLDIAFHGLLRIRLAASRGGSSSSDAASSGHSSISMSTAKSFINKF